MKPLGTTIFQTLNIHFYLEHYIDSSRIDIPANSSLRIRLGELLWTLR